MQTAAVTELGPASWRPRPGLNTCVRLPAYPDLARGAAPRQAVHLHGRQPRHPSGGATSIQTSSSLGGPAHVLTDSPAPNCCANPPTARLRISSVRLHARLESAGTHGMKVGQVDCRHRSDMCARERDVGQAHNLWSRLGEQLRQLAPHLLHLGFLRGLRVGAQGEVVLVGTDCARPITSECGDSSLLP